MEVLDEEPRFLISLFTLTQILQHISDEELGFVYSLVRLLMS